MSKESKNVCSNFVFSRPNVISSIEKSNLDAQTDTFSTGSDIFSTKSNNISKNNPFVFASPTNIEKIDLTDNDMDFDESVKVSVKRVKESASFHSLQKNSKSSQNFKLELAKSITCSEVPEILLVKSTAKSHFEKFGEILKITVRPRRKMITIYFSTKDAAQKALEMNSYFGDKYRTEWTTSDILTKPRKSETIKKKIESILNINDDVQEELAAMTGLEYNLPEPSNIKTLAAAAKAKVKRAKLLANKGVQKVHKTISKTTKSPKVTEGTNIEKSSVKKLIKPVLKKPLEPKSRPNKSVISEALMKPIPDIRAIEVEKYNISSSTIEELQNLLRQPAHTSEEKYKVLDARDRLLRLKKIKPKTLANAKATQGTCPDMCPEKERLMRESQRQVAAYEILDGSEYKICHERAVKQYSRSSADQEEPMPHDLRPVKTLKMTMSYLLHKIADMCEIEDTNLAEWFHFLWDRTRGIRKDITQQELCCKDSVELVEQCARFHIICSERLCAEDIAVFDPKINSENLTKCLQSLKYMYHDLRQKGFKCKNEAEFRAYIILLNLNNGSFMAELRTLPTFIQRSSTIKFALEVYSAITLNNYCQFFKLVKQTTFLNACILLRYFNQMRAKALSIMVKAYCRTSGTTEYPLYELIDILGFEDEEDAIEFCHQLGLRCSRDNFHIKLNKENFREPENKIEQVRAFNLVQSKRVKLKWSIGQCIAGGTLPEKTFQNHTPHDSFDSNGILFRASYNAEDQNVEDTFAYEEAMETEEVKVNIEAQPVESPVNNQEMLLDESPKSNEFMPLYFANEQQFSKKTPDASFYQNKEGLITLDNNENKQNNIPDGIKFLQTNIFSTKTGETPISTLNPSLPVNSQIDMTVNKSIFSGASRPNVFKVPTSESSKSLFSKLDNHVNNRISMKRRNEDHVDSTGKKSYIKAISESVSDAEAEKNQIMEKERKIELEKQRQLFLERELNEQSELVYKLIESMVIEDICSNLIQTELEKIRFYNSLSNNIYENIFQDICESILDEQLFIQDMLIEVSKRYQIRLMKKYFSIWKKQAANKRIRRRQALDHTPLWMQTDSIEECARKFYSPEQNIAIKYAREKRRKSDFQETQKSHTPIEYVISVGLKENSKLPEMSFSKSFWKMVISWPNLDDRCVLQKHKRAINHYLNPKDPNSDSTIITHKINPFEMLYICIRHLDWIICEQLLIGMDALLFIASADEDYKGVEKRFTKTILSREKLMPLPIVIIIFGSKTIDPHKLNISPIAELLLNSGHISKYTILFEYIEKDHVLQIIQSAILWLAIHKSPVAPLEMSCLHKIAEDCLAEDLWLRIQGHLVSAPQFSKALENPNLIIDLHNEAVHLLADIILDPESMQYTDFAPEFKIFINNNQTLPCNYENFDNMWKDVEYRADIEHVIGCLTLPKWCSVWPIEDPLKLDNALREYCSNISLRTDVEKLRNKITSDIFLIIQSENFPSFIDIILNIIKEKIRNINETIKVVYNKNHLKQFQTLPWWFKSKVLMDYSSDENFNLEYERKVVKEPEIDFNTTLSEVLEEFDSIHEQFHNNPIECTLEDSPNMVADIKMKSKKLEESLEQHQKNSEVLQKKLEKALMDN